MRAGIEKHETLIYSIDGVRNIQGSILVILNIYTCFQRPSFVVITTVIHCQSPRARRSHAKDSI